MLTKKLIETESPNKTKAGTVNVSLDLHCMFFQNWIFLRPGFIWYECLDVLLTGQTFKVSIQAMSCEILSEAHLPLHGTES